MPTLVEKRFFFMWSNNLNLHNWIMLACKVGKNVSQLVSHSCKDIPSLFVWSKLMFYEVMQSHNDFKINNWDYQVRTGSYTHTWDRTTDIVCLQFSYILRWWVGHFLTAVLSDNCAASYLATESICQLWANRPFSKLVISS